MHAHTGNILCDRAALVGMFISLALLQAAVAADGQLMVRVVDNATGKKLPARLVVRAADGTYPGDRISASAERWPNIEAHGIFIDGETTLDLPAGNTFITAAHGLEYKVNSHQIEVRAGESQTLELRLDRSVDMRREGWVAGDLHVHMIHGENQRPTSYEDVALTCRSNGLDFVSVGQEYVGAGTLDLEGYKAKCRAVSDDDFCMFLGGERPKNILGHQVLLGCDNPFAISEEVPYFAGVRNVHAQGGISVYVHPLRYFPEKHYAGKWLDFPGNNLARELIFDAYLGPSFDGLSVLSDEPAQADAHRLWFMLLNRGFFVPVFADSDACFDRPTLGLKVPGLWNTYFHIGRDTPVTQSAICNAVREGQTFATTGPLVLFDVDQQISGATLAPDGADHTVTIKAFYPQHSFSLKSVDKNVSKPFGVARIELIRNGIVVKQWQPDATEVVVQQTIQETERCWYAVRVYGTDDRWQVAVTSPIYFASGAVRGKQQPREALVLGRIYDFTSGQPQRGTVSIRRGPELIRQITADGAFELSMPLDAEITVEVAGARPITKNLLMDYGPVHRFLWYLESRDLGKEETLDRFEFLTRSVELEFPIGFRMPGCFVAAELEHATPFDSVRVIDGPERASNGTVAVAAVLTDADRIAPGDSLHVAVIFRDEGAAAKCGPYVVEARGYDPLRPTGFGALKRFASFERNWTTAEDLGEGFKLVAGTIELPSWVVSGPVDWIDLSIRARQGDGDAAFIGMAIPLGVTRRSLTLSNSWPTMPLSWPDRSYGIGPLKICNRIGRHAQPLADYRKLHLSLEIAGRKFDLLPERDGRGCPESTGAVYADHYLDQILNEQSRTVMPQ